MNSILLRFRDTELDIDTIKDHLKLIDIKGYVWWGWWKKSDEPDNSQALSDFRNKILKGQEDKIGIFDRSTGRFFIAQNLDIVFNFDLKIDSPEKHLTPEYYNDIKLHCWFKLCSIKKISEPEFIKQFGVIPLKQETLYILPYEDESSTKSRKIIGSNYILHLSDIHFGNDFGFPHISLKDSVTLLSRLENYFEFTNKIQIGLVIVSGDITSRANIAVLQGPATEFLTKLCELLKINKEQLVIVPGNHDIPIEDANFHDYNHENAYKIFLRNFYGGEKDIFGYEKFVTNNGLEIDVLRINSARLKNKSEKNFGYVGWNDYRHLIEKNIDVNSKSIKIAVLHHHLIPIQSEEHIDDAEYPFGSVSMTLDAGRVIEGLHQYNFDMVLHGHQHLPGINKITRGMINGTNMNLDRVLFLLGAGSAGARIGRLSDHLRDNSFSIISLDPIKITIESVQYNMTREPVTFFNSEIKIVRQPTHG